MIIDIKAKLVAFRRGRYSKLVFESLDAEKDSWDRYVMVTVCPNWIIKEPITIEDEGVLTYKSVTAGDKYYDSKGKEHMYKTTDNLFVDFIHTGKKTVLDFKFKK